MRAKKGYSLPRTLSSEADVDLDERKPRTFSPRKFISWDQTTNGGSLQTSDSLGDTLVCVAISVKSSKEGSVQKANGVDEDKLKQLAKEKITEYVNNEHDYVLDFHRQGKGGLPGAKVWKVLEDGRSQDQSSMGYNVLMKYPSLENVKIIRSNTQRPSILLIEQALLYAKEKGIKEVVAFSRPSGFREYLIRNYYSQIV